MLPRRMCIAHTMTQKQSLIGNAMLLIPKHAIFIQTNMKKEKLKIKELTQKEKNGAQDDDTLMLFDVLEL